MHIRPPDGAAWPLLVLLSSILWLHIAAGAGGVACGFAALFLPKGRTAHRLAGRGFVACLVVLGLTGAATAPFLPIAASQVFADVLLGLFAGYLALSGWASVARAGWARQIERWAGIAPGLLALAVLAIAAMWTRDLKTYGALQTGVMFGLAGLLGLCAGADVRGVLRTGLSARARTVRHLWRMCTGLALATAGGLAQSGVVERISPAWRSPWLVASPVLVVLATMIFWLARMRLSVGIPRP